MDANFDEELQSQIEKSIKVVEEVITAFQKFINDLKSESEEASTDEQREVAHADPGQADPGSTQTKD
jgi:hypothetical protein